MTRGFMPLTPRAESKAAYNRDKRAEPKRVSRGRISCDNHLGLVSKRASGGLLMLVGVPREIKDNEFRVGMTPAAVAELVHHGHGVIVETSAGLGSGSPDEEYIRAGAKIVATGADIFAQAEMIVKVKEPLAEERKRLKRGQILFTYLHLA